MNFDAKKFWEKRFSSDLNLRATGHRAFDLNYNTFLYQAQVDTVLLGIEKFGIRTQSAALLDVGSGGGFYVDLFQKLGSHPITGVDITEASIHHLRTLFPENDFVCVNISDDNLPFQQRFDIIAAMSVMFHITSQNEFNKALGNICDLLNNQGIVLICDSFVRTIIPAPRHVKMRSIADYVPVLHDHNLEVLGLLPMYYLLNRTYIPFLGPWLINHLNLASPIYRVDRWLRERMLNNLDGIKLLVARKKDAF